MDISKETSGTTWSSKRLLEFAIRSTCPILIRRTRGRQVILATTAAVTSITIEDIDIIIDTGATNVDWYRHQDRTQQLSTMVVSQSRAIQHVGRAGRKRRGSDPDIFSGIFHPHLFIEYLLCRVLLIVGPKIPSNTRISSQVGNVAQIRLDRWRNL
jgi:hypothetical protein